METAFPGAGTVTGGVVLTSKLEGRVVIPPKCIFCVSVTSVATTATGNLFFRWVEEQVTNATS
jgi:small neutral amino acid transporter SnatA (MarC family)